MDRGKIQREPAPIEANSLAATPPAEEALVSDARAGLTPAQMVERKLVAMLRSAPRSRSRFQATGAPRPGS
jgi:hypothetical protein